MKRSVLAGIVALAVVASGCASSASRSRGSADTIRLGVFPNLTHAPGLVAIQGGIFDKDLSPAKVEVHPFNSGSDASAALLSGSLDATYIGPGPTLSMWVKSDKVAVVSGVTSGGASFVVRKGVSISSAQDLHGKKVAVPGIGNTQDVALRTWLEDRGLKAKDDGGDVAIVPVDNPELPQVFRSGDVDAAWEPEPWPSLLESQGLATRFIDEATLWPDGKFVTTLLVVSKGYLDAHPEVVKKLVQANFDAIEQIESDPDGAKADARSELVTLGASTLPEDVLDSAWNKLEFSWDPLVSALRTNARNAFATKAIEEDPGDLAGLVQLNYLNSVLASAGKPKVRAA